MILYNIYTVYKYKRIFICENKGFPHGKPDLLL